MKASSVHWKLKSGRNLKARETQMRALAHVDAGIEFNKSKFEIAKTRFVEVGFVSFGEAPTQPS
jgi:hypothetical protein